MSLITAADGHVEEWVASPNGGFVRATYDMPSLLSEAGSPDLYDVLVAHDLSAMSTRFDRIGREGFLKHLKEEVGLGKLSDRQLFTNALGRAKRVGSFGTAAP